MNTWKGVCTNEARLEPHSVLGFLARHLVLAGALMKRCIHCDRQAINHAQTLCGVHMAQMISDRVRLKRAAKKFQIKKDPD